MIVGRNLSTACLPVGRAGRSDPTTGELDVNRKKYS